MRESVRVKARARRELRPELVGLRFLFPALLKRSPDIIDRKGVRKSALPVMSENGFGDQGERVSLDLLDGVFFGDVSGFMGKNAREFIVRIDVIQQPARHENRAAGKRLGVRDIVSNDLEMREKVTAERLRGYLRADPLHIIAQQGVAIHALRAFQQGRQHAPDRDLTLRFGVARLNGERKRSVAAHRQTLARRGGRRRKPIGNVLEGKRREPLTQYITAAPCD